MGQRRISIAATVFVALLLIPTAAAYWNIHAGMDFYLRERRETADEVVGYLVAKGASPRIAWDPDAPTDARYGTPPAGVAEVNYGEDVAYKFTGLHLPTFGPSGPDTFTSDPVPVALALNASRPIKVDLYITGRTENVNQDSVDPCYGYGIATPGGGSVSGGGNPRLELVLSIGDQIIAGAAGAQSIQWENGVRPRDPDGVSLCRFQMPPEIFVIPADSVLTLTVIHAAEQSGFEYSLRGAARSVLRFPVFSQDEWFYRNPETSPRPPTQAAVDPGVSASGFLLPGLGLGLVVRRSRFSVLAAMMVGATGVSGCLNGPDGAENGSKFGGRATYTIDPSAGGTGGAGTIRGLVLDPDAYPVYNAHVAILGQPKGTDTDGNGRFTLSNVSAGRATLRIDHPEFETIETPIDVEPGATTRIDVNLVIPDNGLGEAGRRHRHDYWQGANEYLVYSGDLGFKCLDAGGCNPRTSFSIPPAAGKVDTLLPGTYEVEVVLGWDIDEMHLDRVGLAVQANDDPNLQNATEYYPRPPGEAFHVQTTWEMSDAGHQDFSTWILQVYQADADVEAPEGPDALIHFPEPYLPGASPSFSVSVKIHKGVVPPEPKHPDHWRGKSVRPMFGPPAYAYYGAPYYPEGSPYSEMYPAYFAPTALVPADTVWVQANLTLDRATSPEFPWHLYYKPGNTPLGEDLTDCTNCPLTVEFKRVAAEPTRDEDTLRWKFALGPGDGDDVYAARTSWWLAVIPADQDGVWNDRVTSPLGQMTLTMTAFAHRDALR